MEKVIAAVAALALVLGVYLIGTAVADDDAPAPQEPAAAAPAAGDGEIVTAGSHAPDDHGEGGHGAAEVDDRGFAALENGEQHEPWFTQAVSPADRVELARQLTLAREVALQYPTVADAERAGLRRAGPFSPGLGAHYISYRGATGNDDGVMSDDDIRNPVAWIYDGTKPDSRVAGLFYGTSKENAEGFAGPNDTWHLHRDVCIKMGANGVDTPLGADRDATKADCDAVGGTLIERTQYLLHLWVVPGYESPEGVFSHLSSAVTCDDGTYNVIEDVTKVGSKTTICVDGTE
jgi:hypothetical protein